MSINYKAAGQLPAEWEDFFSEASCFPNVSIWGGQNTEDISFCDDGWVDVALTATSITEEIAKMCLETVAGIPVTVEYGTVSSI